MRFNRAARLDTSQVSDRRGGRGGAIAAGGGGLGLVGVLLVILLNALGGGGGVATTGVPARSAAEGGEVAASCQTGADANQRQDCRVVALVNSVQDHWDTEFTDRGWEYRPAATTIFEGGVNTGCGSASSAVDERSVALFEELTATDIREGLDAAAAVGDDRIQERAQGRTDPESWTHGSAEERQRWFLIGYRSGTPDACDTFASDALPGG